MRNFFLSFQGSDGGESEYESADEEELGEEEEEEEDELIIMPDGLVLGEVRSICISKLLLIKILK